MVGSIPVAPKEKWFNGSLVSVETAKHMLAIWIDYAKYSW